MQYIPGRTQFAQRSDEFINNALQMFYKQGIITGVVTLPVFLLLSLFSYVRVDQQLQEQSNILPHVLVVLSFLSPTLLWLRLTSWPLRPHY